MARSTPNGCNVITPFHRFFFGKDLPFRVPCCDEHDLFYQQGGTRADRAFADKLFRECIREAGYPKSAWVCWAAVRLAGWWNWGG